MWRMSPPPLRWRLRMRARRIESTTWAKATPFPNRNGREASGWRPVGGARSSPFLNRFEQHLVAETSRFRKELGYEEETPRQEALRRAIEWERANSPAEIDLKRFDYAAEDAALKRIPPQDGA